VLTGKKRFFSADWGFGAAKLREFGVAIKG